LEIEVNKELSKEKHPIVIGIDEMSATAEALRGGSDKPAILITVDELEDSYKINMCTFNLDTYGVLLTMIQAVRLIEEGSLQRPETMQ
jgi:hypothetical protein